MRDPGSPFDDGRLEAALREALRTDVAALRVEVTGQDLRRRIANRERERRYGRLLVTGLAAVLVVAIGVTAGPWVVDKVIGPAQTPAAVEAAVAVRLEDMTGGRRDLVVESVGLEGEPRIIARIPDALASLGGGIDPARVELGTKRASVAYDPDGFLAIGVTASDAPVSTGIVLVYDLAHPDRTAARVEGAQLDWRAGGVQMAWGPDARLFVLPSWIVDGRSGQVGAVNLGANNFPWWESGTGRATWTGDGRLIVMRSDPQHFKATLGTAAVPGDGSVAPFVEGIPANVFSIAGLERAWGRDGREVTVTSDQAGLHANGFGVATPFIDDSHDSAWWLVGRDEQVVGWPAWDASGQGMWALVGVDRRLDLLHLDGPGEAAQRGSLPWAGDATAAAIAGVAPDGRGLAVRDAAADLLVDGMTGAYRTLPAGDRFAGWTRAVTVAVPTQEPLASCSATGVAPLAGVRLGGSGYGPLRDGIVAATSGGPAPQAWSGWHAGEVDSALVAQATVTGGLRLLVPPATCISSFDVRAVPLGDPTAAPVVLVREPVGGGLSPGPGPSPSPEPGPMTASPLPAPDATDVPSPWYEGVHAAPAPPAGDWIVRVDLAAAGDPSSGAGPATVTLLFHVVVAAPGAATAAPSSAPIAPQLVLPAPDSPILEQPYVVTWTASAGSADAPANGVHVFGTATEAALRRGTTKATVACTGRGTLRIAAVPAPPPGAQPAVEADRWVAIPCGSGPLDRVETMVDLPPARGGETALVVQRERPIDALEQVAYFVMVGQPIGVACADPTIASIGEIGLVSAQDPTPVQGVIAGYDVPGASLPFAGWQLAAIARRPAAHGAEGGFEAGWALTLPPNLCATGYTWTQVPVGGDPVFVAGSTGGSQDQPSPGRLERLTPDGSGDVVVRLDVSLVGPDGRAWSVDLLFHAVVAPPAGAAPSPSPTLSPSLSPSP